MTLLVQIAPSDADDDRGALREHDYLLSIDESPLSGLSLADVRALIRNAGDATRFEAWRPLADGTTGDDGDGSSCSDGGDRVGAVTRPQPAARELHVSPFEAGLDYAEFGGGDAGEAEAPTEAVESRHAGTHAAFHRLQETCAEGQRGQAVLLASCAAYRSELGAADEQVAQLTAELAAAHTQLERLAETVRHLSRGGE